MLQQVDVFFGTVHLSLSVEAGSCLREGFSGGGGGRDVWNALVMGSQGARDVLMKSMISWSRPDIHFARPPHSFQKVMMSKMVISWLLVGLVFLCEPVASLLLCGGALAEVWFSAVCHLFGIGSSFLKRCVLPFKAMDEAGSTKAVLAQGKLGKFGHSIWYSKRCVF